MKGNSELEFILSANETFSDYSDGVCVQFPCVAF